MEYSLEEKRIGTWINGKPVYRRVIEAQFAFREISLTIEHGYAEMIINRRVYINPSDDDEDMFTIDINGVKDIRCGVSQTRSFPSKTVISRNSAGAWGDEPKILLILEYTKTTD